MEIFSLIVAIVSLASLFAVFIAGIVADKRTRKNNQVQPLIGVVMPRKEEN